MKVLYFASVVARVSYLLRTVDFAIVCLSITTAGIVNEQFIDDMEHFISLMTCDCHSKGDALHMCAYCPHVCAYCRHVCSYCRHMCAYFVNVSAVLLIESLMVI